MAKAGKLAKMVLVAHGSKQSGAFSNPGIRIITKADQPLIFGEAKKYLDDGQGPEFASSSLGYFKRLTDEECKFLFNKVPGAGPGLVDTGTKIKSSGVPVFVLRGHEKISFAELAVHTGRTAEKCILLACRT